MRLIYRKKNYRIINYRQSADWNGQPKLDEALDNFQHLPSDATREERRIVKDHIARIEQERDAWIQRFLENAKVDPETHNTLVVPKGQEHQASTARYINYDGSTLTYDMRPLYTIESGVVIISSGWVWGNECLEADDITDFSEMSLEEPLFFKLVFVQNRGTQEVSVQLFIRTEEETFGMLPPNLDELFVVCQGRVNIDHSISEEVV